MYLAVKSVVAAATYLSQKLPWSLLSTCCKSCPGSCYVPIFLEFIEGRQGKASSSPHNQQGGHHLGLIIDHWGTVLGFRKIIFCGDGHLWIWLVRPVLWLKDDLNIFLRFFIDCPRFHFILFRFAVFASFSFCCRFISFSFGFRCKNKRKSKKKFRFRFASKRKWRQFSLLFRFIMLHFIFVALLISTFRIDAKKQAKKHFCVSKWKNFASVSLWSENDGFFEPGLDAS